LLEVLVSCWTRPVIRSDMEWRGLVSALPQAPDLDPLFDYRVNGTRFFFTGALPRTESWPPEDLYLILDLSAVVAFRVIL